MIFKKRNKDLIRTPLIFCFTRILSTKYRHRAHSNTKSLLLKLHVTRKNVTAAGFHRIIATLLFTDTQERFT